MNGVLFAIVGVLLFSFLFAYTLRVFKIPAAVAYIITGLVVGPSGLGWVQDEVLLEHLGELGVIMLMFFVGMEVSMTRLVEHWRISVIGTFAQMTLSVAVCSLTAWLMNWTWQAGLLFGFIISMSSTAVVLIMLKDSEELETPLGQHALGILLMQDLAIVPIMIVLGMLGGNEISMQQVLTQVIGGVVLLALVVWILRHPGWHIPDALKQTLDKRIMMGLLLCFSAAGLTASLGLSAPFGAFLAGMVLNSSDQAEWVEEHLRSLYVVFVAIFFLSVGMLVDLSFMWDHIFLVLMVTLAVFVLNSGINTITLRLLGESWAMSLMTGALLSQIGELSFLLASLGLSLHILSHDGHQMAMIVIAFSLILSPLWMLLIRVMIQRDMLRMDDNTLDTRLQSLLQFLRIRK
ncbi:MAG: cation:proton antiporter [Mariprofundaceae bacterium]|nr:cation:proton antiporter [Mariprofundaceae bacterium]